MKKIALLFLGLCLLFSACTSCSKSKQTPTPAQTFYGPLFYDVLNCDALFGPDKLFVESKSFLDLIPKRAMEDILADYAKLKKKDKQDPVKLEAFLRENFNLVGSDMPTLRDTSDIDTHIQKLWTALRRQPDSQAYPSTLIPLQHSYQVPGGRFTEIYYWDSYFTMLGLMADNQVETVSDMVQNFSELIDSVGFIPNGNRQYYLGRSQPPFFSYMVELLAQEDKDAPKKYFKTLEKEYAFWMEGKDNLSEEVPAQNHVVCMPKGEVLNRYYDKYDSPRDEMYRNDIQTGKELQARNKKADVHELYRNLRAGAESGWDFSSRWLTTPSDLSTIHTTDIVPVDLNCLLYHLESTLAQYAKKLKKTSKEKEYEAAAAARKKAIRKYFWNEKECWFMDYDYKQQTQTSNLTIAGIFPLYVGVASKSQAKKAGETVENTFLKAGGVVTTLENTGQQWDAPNGWAPHQWVTYIALRENGKKKLAKELRSRWMGMVEKVYAETHKLLEKYDVERASNTGGGEYANQDGFGWTNGVYRAFKEN